VAAKRCGEQQDKPVFCQAFLRTIGRDASQRVRARSNVVARSGDSVSRVKTGVFVAKRRNQDFANSGTITALTPRFKFGALEAVPEFDTTSISSAPSDQAGHIIGEGADVSLVR